MLECDCEGQGQGWRTCPLIPLWHFCSDCRMYQEQPQSGWECQARVEGTSDTCRGDDAHQEQRKGSFLRFGSHRRKRELRSEDIPWAWGRISDHLRERNLGAKVPVILLARTIQNIFPFHSVAAHRYPWLTFLRCWPRKIHYTFTDVPSHSKFSWCLLKCDLTHRSLASVYFFKSKFVFLKQPWYYLDGFDNKGTTLRTGVGLLGWYIYRNSSPLWCSLWQINPCSSLTANPHPHSMGIEFRGHSNNEVHLQPLLFIILR